MPFIEVPSAIEVVANYTCGGEKMANVFHVEGVPSDLADGPSRDAILLPFVDWWTATKAVISNRVTLVDWSLKYLGAEGQPTYRSPSGVAGSGVGGQIPNQVALAISWRTALSGKSYRGRTYLPPLDKNGTTSTTSQPDATTLTVVHDAAEALITDAAAAAHPLVIVSRYSNKLPRDPGIYTEVTDARVGNTLDTQRRRRTKLEAYTG